MKKGSKWESTNPYAMKPDLFEAVDKGIDKWL